VIRSPGGQRRVTSTSSCDGTLVVVQGRPPAHRREGFPVHPAPALFHLADPATQRRRYLRLAATLIANAVRGMFVSPAPTRRRQRLQVCSAARVLTALGVRTQVFPPSTPWPRARPNRLVLGADVGWLGDLALVTAVPKTTAGWSQVADRALTGRRATTAGAPLDAVPCPVAIRYRSEAGPLDRLPTTLSEIVAIRGLVVEVHLLPALGLAREATPAAA
jgi:hypothetical protein